MRKYYKKIISVLIATIILFTITPITTFALTQDDIVNWMNSKNGTTIKDGGTQCVAAFNSYLRIWGISNPISKYPVNYAYQIFDYNAPDGWQKISGSGNYQVGDIVIWNNSIGGGAGHVGMVYSTSGGTVKIFDQNYVVKNVCGIHNLSQTSAIRGIFRPPLNFGNNPTGAIDGAVGGTSTIHITGWAFDKDDLNAQLNIHVYIGGPSGDSNAEGHSQIWANKGRADVNNAFGCGNYHGYDDVIITSKTGTQKVYVYAINVGGGSNVLIGETTVNITADTEAPVCQAKYISQVTNDSYRVCIVPKDNVGVKAVRIATWSQSDQSDLIWKNASFNGKDTYYVDINRSDYSKTKNSVYYNHAYIYDYAGNSTFASIDMDYRIKSNTGEQVPEGEYRIVTAINKNRALDVAQDSALSGANIQIFSNLDNPKQTFLLTHLDNDFYSISNTFSGCVLDVNGDTYLNNTNVVQHTANGGANQEWMFAPSEDGYYYIIAHSNGLALDLTYAKDEDGANVAVHTQNQSSAQKWKLRRVLKDDMIEVEDVILSNDSDEVLPNINVIVDGNKIEVGTDYNVLVSSNIEKGKGTVTITGLNNYCDTVTKNFDISIAETKTVLGDVNGDGEVTILDATMIQRYLVKLVEFDSENLAVADVNGDGVVTILDVTMIQRYLVNLIPLLLAEK